MKMIGVVLAWAMAVAVLPAGEAPPSVVRAEPDAEFNAKFNGQQGWIGGDCVFSEKLGDDRILWLFGDTLLGAVKDKGRPGAAIVNNTIGIGAGRAADSPIRFIHAAGKDGKPAAFF